MSGNCGGTGWWAAVGVVHLEVPGVMVVIVDRENSLSACPAPTRDACGRHWTFPRGVGYIPSPLSLAYRGNPRTYSSNSGGGVVFLLDGVAWCEALRDAGSAVVLRRRVQRLPIFLSSLICRCRHLFPFPFLLFSFGLFCAAAPASWMYRMFAL